PFYSQDTPEGGFNQASIYREETNIDGLLTAQRSLSDKLSLSMTGGGNWRRNTGDTKSAGTRRLKVPDIYNVGNSVAPPVLLFEESKKEVHSLYGTASLAYNDYLFLDLTARNDWSSTLPQDNNSYFYPSVSTSVVLTDLFQGLPQALSYAKLRVSWARVGNDADPYQLAAVYNEATPFNGVPGFTADDQIPNRNLRPEQTDSWEVGTDLRFAEDRASLDLTYYNSHTKDQILGVTVSDASGYGSQILNAGEIKNSGFEVLLNTTVLRQQGGRPGWDITTNFSRNSSEVVSLYPGLEALQLVGQDGMVTCCGITVEARPGQKYGALVGTVWATDEQGRVKLSSQGIPLVADDRAVLGYFQPDWMAGIRNTIRYAGVDITFQIDHRQGGQIVCGTCQLGRRTGILAETADYGRETGIVVDGVLPDGSQNNVSITARSYAQALNRNLASDTYDATWTKLREVTIGFGLPQGFLDKLRMSSGRASVVGRNLWLWTDVPHIDPETARSNSNYQGVEFEQFPTPRSVGFNISLRR
ncbi:MAG TPA: TonB-dependent receptor, partial [Longimicrobiales bacterium]|nr:TonB-dependent receptor [Longimicrobiales bacterium]